MRHIRANEKYAARKWEHKMIAENEKVGEKSKKKEKNTRDRKKSAKKKSEKKKPEWLQFRRYLKPENAQRKL